MLFAKCFLFSNNWLSAAEEALYGCVDTTKYTVSEPVELKVNVRKEVIEVGEDLTGKYADEAANGGGRYNNPSKSGARGSSLLSTANVYFDNADDFKITYNEETSTFVCTGTAPAASKDQIDSFNIFNGAYEENNGTKTVDTDSTKYKEITNYCTFEIPPVDYSNSTEKMNLAVYKVVTDTNGNKVLDSKQTVTDRSVWIQSSRKDGEGCDLGNVHGFVKEGSTTLTLVYVPYTEGSFNNENYANKKLSEVSVVETIIFDFSQLTFEKKLN